MLFDSTINYFVTHHGTLLLLVAVVGLGGAVVGAWIQYAQSRWSSQLIQFHRQHHGYKTQKEEKQNDDILLIVSPNSGNGTSIRHYASVIDQFDKQNCRVEVYVTKSGDDMMTLTTTKDLKPYKTIALLSGDSSIFEFVQSALLRNHGKWPYAPIMILPGGSGNAIACDFYGSSKDVRKIIKAATTVRECSVIQATNGKDIIYSVHNCFDGIQRHLIDWLDSNRPIISTLGNKIGMPIMLICYLVSLSFSRSVRPIVVAVINSDIEGGSHSLGYGVDRSDDKMALTIGGPYSSNYTALKAFVKHLSGSIGKLFSESSGSYPLDMRVQVGNELTLPVNEEAYKLYFDGSSTLPLEGKHISFKIISKAIPFYSFH